MNTKPILMSAPMVQAILGGRKTQTRRVMKPQPRLGRLGSGEAIGKHPGMLGDQYHVWTPKPGVDVPLTTNSEFIWRRFCPYGTGDLLYVREAWAWHPYALPDTDPEPIICYRATDAGPPNDEGWKPSIHMPRRFSRLTLRITDVRVERVQEISEEDAQAEGIQAWIESHKNGPAYHQNGQLQACPVIAFARLWDSLNAARGYPWSENPWVWVVEFEPILENVDAALAREEA